MSETNSQAHGVFFVGRLVVVHVRQSGGYQNGDIVLLRDGSRETDKISFKPDSDLHTFAAALPVGTDVVVKVIPARRAVSKAGNVYVKPPFALAIETA